MFSEHLINYVTNQDIEARFGGGVAAYFTIFRWQSMVGLVAAIIIFLVHIPHLVRVFHNRKRQYGSIAKTFQWSDFTGIPFFLQFQSYEYILYTAMSLSMILYYCVTLMYQVILETRVQSEHAIKSKDMENKRYSKLLLNCWDHSQVDNSSVRDQRLIIAQSLRILIDEDSRKEEVTRRPYSQKIMLIVRKVVSNIFLTIVFIVAIGSIVTIRQFDSVIQEKLGSKIDISKWPSWIPFKEIIRDNIASVIISVAIVIINYITPTIAHYVTEFELWDEPKTALRMLVIRYFALRIATIFVLIYQFAVLLDAIKGGCDKCENVDKVGNQLFFVVVSSLAFEFIVDPALIIIFFVFQWIRAKVLTYQLRKRLKKQLVGQVDEDSSFHRRSKVVPIEDSSNRNEELQEESSSSIEIEVQSGNTDVDQNDLITTVRTEKDEFQTAPKLMSLIYLQTVMWMCLIYYPFGIVIIGICNIILFKFQIVLVTWLLKKPKNPVDARTQSGLFSILYIVSFLTVAVYYYYALDLHRVKTENCGPLEKNRTIMDSLEEGLSKVRWGVVLMLIFNHVLTNSALIWLVVGGMIVLYFWRSYSMHMMNKYISMLSTRLLGEQKVYEEKLLQQEQEAEILKSRLDHFQGMKKRRSSMTHAPPHTLAKKKFP